MTWWARSRRRWARLPAPLAQSSDVAGGHRPRLTTLRPDAFILLPPKLSKCPICGARVIIEEINEWEQCDDGSWMASEAGVIINCETEPEIGSQEWEGWFRRHWEMPYVDWLPLQVKVFRWLARYYRFDLGKNE